MKTPSTRPSLYQSTQEKKDKKKKKSSEEGNNGAAAVEKAAEESEEDEDENPEEAGPLGSAIRGIREFVAGGKSLGQGGGSRALSYARQTNAKRPEWCPHWHHRPTALVFARPACMSSCTAATAFLANHGVNRRGRQTSNLMMVYVFGQLSCS